MRVIQVISHYVPGYQYGGPLQVAHSLGKELVSLGHSVSVYTTDNSLISDRVGRNAVINSLIDGVNVYYCNASDMVSRWGYSKALKQTLKKRFDTDPPDIALIHDHFQYAGFVGSQLCLSRGIPYVLFPHGSLRRRSINSSNRLLKSIYLHFLMRSKYEKSAFIAFNITEEKKDSWFSERGEIVHNGTYIIEPEFERSFDRGIIKFLYIGRLAIHQKGLDILFEAFAKFNKNVPDSELQVAGATECVDFARICVIVKQLGLENKVKFLGQVNGTKKIELFKQSDIFLLPSRYEGLSIALLEAMSWGLPVIISNNCGLSEILERERLGLVADCESGSICEAMYRLQESCVRSALGTRARNFVRDQFGWPSIAKVLEAKLKAVVDG